MTADFLGWSGDTWIAVSGAGVALGTGLLAIATFKLARGARKQVDAAVDQARATNRMVTIAERQLAATGEPSLGVSRIWPGTLDGDGTATINLQNLGATPARVVEASIARGGLNAKAILDVGTIAPGGDDHAVIFEFHREPEAGEVTLSVIYEGPGSGLRAQLVANLLYKPDDEVLVLLREKNSRLS